MEHEFNLIDQPWIPAVDSNGAARDVPLAEILVNAHQYSHLSATFPHATAALYRLLLAILHRIFGPSSDDEWHRLWLAEQFDPQPIRTYFARWHNRFDLFSPERPFMQNRHPQVETKPANALLFLVAGGDPDTLYNHNLDTKPATLSPAYAAQVLITTHSFGLAGICHPQLGLFYNDASCARGVVFFLQGRNLFQSLMLNLVRYNRFEPIPFHGELPDLPSWEMDDPYLPERSIPLGYLDFLTWQNRRIMLFPSLRQGKTVVEEVCTAPGLVLSTEQRNPMHHYRLEKDGRKILRFVEGRALWRDSSAILNLRAGNLNPQALIWANELISYGYLPEQKIELAAYGMSTEPGKKKVFFYHGEHFEFSDRLLNSEELTQKLEHALDLAQELRNQLWGALRRLALLLLSEDANQDGGRKSEKKDVEKLMSHWEAESQYWNKLEIPFYHFLDALPQDSQGAFQRWTKQLRQAVMGAFEQTTEMCGNHTKALKAAALARVQLLSGINKLINPHNQEEKDAIPT